MMTQQSDYRQSIFIMGHFYKSEVSVFLAAGEGKNGFFLEKKRN
jgi:hypothetical protein